MTERHWQEGTAICPFLLVDYLVAMGHFWYYNRCLNCAARLTETWEGNLMPLLSSVSGNHEATWAPQVDKRDLEDMRFWIHDARPSDYTDDKGQDVHIIVCDITVNSESRKGPRAVIVLGRVAEREDLLAYFTIARQEKRTPDPLGPCITYLVALDGGMSFWRLEDAPDEESSDAKLFAPPAGRKTR